jgi:hypothetical protein
MSVKLLYVLIPGILAIHTLQSEGNIIEAESCLQAHVQAAIDMAEDGDIVLIPPGECTWTSPPNAPAVIIDRKSITLQGSGAEQTIINDNTAEGTPGYSWGDVALRINGIVGKPFRLTGIRFQRISGGGVNISGTAMGWRIDNCDFISSDAGWTVLSIDGYTYGVISNNYFLNSRVLPREGRGHESWKRPLNLGKNNAVFVENNTFERTRFGNSIDSNHGGRYVFRFNAVINSSCEVHSLQNAWDYDSTFARATRSYEIYHNRFEAIDNEPTHTNWIGVFVRGGTGVIFNNRIDNLGGPTYNLFGVVDNVRSFSERIYPLLSCDGSNPLDGNEEENGYPCLDQIGRSTDYGPGDQYHPQKLDPLYSWNNMFNGLEQGLAVHNNTGHHIKEGRDFINFEYKPEYVFYPFPHPATLDDRTEGNYSLNLVAIVEGTAAALTWENVTGTHTYKIVIDWDEENEILTTGNNIEVTISAGGNVFVVYALDDEGEIIAAEGKYVSPGTTGGIDPNVAYTFDLHQNYPNPFNPTTTINYSLPATSHVSLKIYDIIGREVVTLVNEVISAGFHTISWCGTESSNQSVGSGIYFYRLQTGDGKVLTKKMTLIK